MVIPAEWFAELQELGLVLCAGFLGGLIGLEREFARRPAGLRTHIFVAAASCLLIVVGEAVMQSYEAAHDGRGGDPTRMIHAVAVGISFLGAGTIYQRHKGSEVEGLTTAASVLFTAGLGIAVAGRQFVLATGLTLFAVFVLYFVGKIEDHFHSSASRRHDSPDDRKHD